LACGDQRRLTGSGSALEVVLHDYALYKSTFTLLYFIHKDRVTLIQLGDVQCSDQCQQGVLRERPSHTTDLAQ